MRLEILHRLFLVGIILSVILILVIVIVFSHGFLAGLAIDGSLNGVEPHETIIDISAILIFILMISGLFLAAIRIYGSWII